MQIDISAVIFACRSYFCLLTGTLETFTPIVVLCPAYKKSKEISSLLDFAECFKYHSLIFGLKL